MISKKLSDRGKENTVLAGACPTSRKTARSVQEAVIFPTHPVDHQIITVIRLPSTKLCRRVIPEGVKRPSKIGTNRQLAAFSGSGIAFLKKLLILFYTSDHRINRNRFLNRISDMPIVHLFIQKLSIFFRNFDLIYKYNFDNLYIVFKLFLENVF